MHDFDRICADLARDYGFLPPALARRLCRAYGLEARDILGAATRIEDLGHSFGAGLYGAEVRWLMEREYARTAEDVIWRRSKLGLRLSAAEIAGLDVWMEARRAEMPEAAE